MDPVPQTRDWHWPGQVRAIIRQHARAISGRAQREEAVSGGRSGAQVGSRPWTDSGRSGRDRWRATTRAKAISRSPERQERFLTTSGVEIQDLYTPADLAGLDETATWVVPGEYPYTRGVQPTMYRGRFWTMRQYAGFSTAADTNRRFRYLLEQGQTGLSVAFDLPTQMGYDSDAPRPRARSGGSACRSAPWPTWRSCSTGCPWDRQHVDDDQRLRGRPAGHVRGGGREAGRGARPGQRHDPERHPQGVHRPGTYIFPPRPSMRLVTDIFEFCSKELPRWNTISISGYHMREAGATAAQELAFTLADGIAYVEGRSAAAWTSTTSPTASASSSPRGASSSRKWPSSAPPAGCGPGSSRSASRPPAPARWPAASTSRPPARRSRRSRSTTTSSGPRSRPWPRSWAAPRASTPTPATRRWLCRRPRPRGSRSARSRSWRTSRA
jgi:hypothetical protein